MRVKSLAFGLVMAFLVSACAAPVGTPPVVITQAPVIPAPTNPTKGAYPIPLNEPTLNPYPITTPTSGVSGYPAPGTPPAGSAVIPPSGFEPKAGDDSLKRDQVFMDMPNSFLAVTLGEPVEAQAILNGNLSDPCHELRVVVTPSNASNVISLEVYSVVEAGKICTAVLQPFSAAIPLGSYTSGEYTVMVNGETLSQFSATYGPQPGDEQLTRGDVTLELDKSKLVSFGLNSGEEGAQLQGYLPDPCHKLRIVLTPADSSKRINLEVYSVYDPQAICNMMVVPFNIAISLGTGLSGHYSVYVNTQLLGEFDK